MARLRALIFDLDGTLAETEELHRAAFNDMFARFGRPDRWDVAEYGRLLTTTGGRQRLARYFAETGQSVSDDDIVAMHREKNRRYAELVAGGIDLRPGVAMLIGSAREAGLKLAIATTTSRANLEALLGVAGLGAFDVLVAGEDVAALKPAPDAYLLALDRLGIPARDAIAFEDSANGVAAALAAGLLVVAVPGLYTADHDLAGATVLGSLEEFALLDE